MEATHRGLVGLVVVGLVVQEWNTVIVPAQIPGQHTEDEGVGTLDHVQNRRVVILSGVQVQFAQNSYGRTNLLELLLCLSLFFFLQ